MNIYLTKENFNINNICFYKIYKLNKTNSSPSTYKPNTKSNNSYKINYLTENINLNGLYIKLDFDFFQILQCDDKYRFLFSIKNNENIIEYVKTMEKQILEKIHINKLPQLNIYEKLKNGYIDISSNDVELDIDKNVPYLILKMFSIWENGTEYGITHKFEKPVLFKIF